MDNKFLNERIKGWKKTTKILDLIKEESKTKIAKKACKE